MKFIAVSSSGTLRGRLHQRSSGCHSLPREDASRCTAFVTGTDGASRLTHSLMLCRTTSLWSVSTGHLAFMHGT